MHRPGIDGVNEPFHLGKVGSNTMPHKRNPASVEFAVALWRLVRGLLLSERVMLALGEEVGKQTAHEIVHEVAMAARKKGTGFREELAADPRAAPYLDREAIRGLLDPARYLGLTGRIVDEVAGRSLS